MSKQTISIQTTVNAPVGKVWEAYNHPEAIQQWNQASDDWHCPSSENDLRAGGRFRHTMAARDGSFSFDFSGTYTEVLPDEVIAYTLDDGRKVLVKFEKIGEQTVIKTDFEAEGMNPAEMQQQGWQAILDNFKKYVENN